MLNDEDVSSVADGIARAQVEQIADAIGRLRLAHPPLTRAVVAGRGAFLASAAARQSGLEVTALSAEIGFEAAYSAPAVAVALLCEEIAGVAGATADASRAGSPPPITPPVKGLIDIVVKVGGGVLRVPGDLDLVCAALEGFAGRRECWIIPGGGPFADVVRDVDRQHALSDTAAHWMAIRAMDVFAEQLVSRLTRGPLGRIAGRALARLSVGAQSRCWRRCAGCDRATRCRTPGTSRATALRRGWRVRPARGS